MSSPEKFWKGLAVVIGQPDLFSEARFATCQTRIDNQEELIRILGAVFATQTRDQWCQRPPLLGEHNDQIRAALDRRSADGTGAGT
jgi:crotonobetainyl-CoA:carnitine CoA-transferase CaiB-like acyl-CoA transferase